MRKKGNDMQMRSILQYIFFNKRIGTWPAKQIRKIFFCFSMSKFWRIDGILTGNDKLMINELNATVLLNYCRQYAQSR